MQSGSASEEAFSGLDCRPDGSVPLSGQLDARRDEAATGGAAECEEPPTPPSSVVDFNTSNLFGRIGAACEAPPKCQENSSPQAGLVGESVRRVLGRLKDLSAEMARAVCQRAQALETDFAAADPLNGVYSQNGPQGHPTGCINASRDSPQLFNADCDNAGPKTPNEAVTLGGQVQALLEDIRDKMNLLACRWKDLPSEEASQLLLCALQEIEVVIKQVDTSTSTATGQAPSTMPAFTITSASQARTPVDSGMQGQESCSYPAAILETPQLQKWVALLQNLARCLRPDAHFPNNGLKSVIVCIMSILRDIQMSLEEVDSQECELPEWRTDNGPVGAPANRANATPALLEQTELLRRFTLSLRPNIRFPDRDPEVLLPCLLATLAEALQTERLDAARGEELRRLLHCLHSELSRQACRATSEAVVAQVEEVQHLLERILAAAAAASPTDRQCTSRQDVHLTETSQLCDIICELQQLIGDTRPEVVFPQCDLKCMIFYIITCLKDIARKGCLNRERAERMEQLLICLECELWTQGLDDSSMSEEIRELQQLARQPPDDRYAPGLETCGSKLKDTSNLSKIVLILEKMARCLSDGEFHLPCGELETRILALLKVVKQGLYARRPEAGLLKKVVKVMRCLDCEVSRQGLRQSAITVATGEIHRVALYLQTHRDDSGAKCGQPVGRMRETPQLTDVMGKLRTHLHHIQPDIYLPNCDLEATVLGLLFALRQAVTSTCPQPADVERLRQLLVQLECELLSLSGGESKIVAAVREIHRSLAPSNGVTCPAQQTPSVESVKWALNSLIAANKCIKQLENILRQRVPASAGAEVGGSSPVCPRAVASPPAEDSGTVQVTRLFEPNEPSETFAQPPADVTTDRKGVALTTDTAPVVESLPMSLEAPSKRSVEYTGTAVNAFPFTHDEWQIAEAIGTIFAGERSNSLPNCFIERGLNSPSHEIDNETSKIHDANPNCDGGEASNASECKTPPTRSPPSTE